MDYNFNINDKNKEALEQKRIEKLREARGHFFFSVLLFIIFLLFLIFEWDFLSLLSIFLFTFELLKGLYLMFKYKN